MSFAHLMLRYKYARPGNSHNSYIQEHQKEFLTERDFLMPIYEYECRKCGERTEQMQKITDKPLTKCRKCGGRLDKQWSSTSFQFKGTGWYVTDYAGKKSEGSEAKEEKAGVGDDKTATTKSTQAEGEKSPRAESEKSPRTESDKSKRAESEKSASKSSKSEPKKTASSNTNGD